MNKKQKTCLLVGITAIVVMGLYPPWVIEYERRLFAGRVFAERSFVAETTGSTHAHWEYGVYCVGASRHRYEWINADEYIYGQSQKSFLQEIGLRARMTLASVRLSEYAFDTEFLNYLGKQGWELIEVIDRGSRLTVDKIYWLKRHKR